jgi:hypothetical protein
MNQQQAIVQIDRDEPNSYYVRYISPKGNIEDDSHHVRMEKAEQRARALAKLSGCDWETNY